LPVEEANSQAEARRLADQPDYPDDTAGGPRSHVWPPQSAQFATMCQQFRPHTDNARPLTACDSESGEADRAWQRPILATEGFDEPGQTLDETGGGDPREFAGLDLVQPPAIDSPFLGAARSRSPR
jgi:hypothetical protein